ncbi:MFS transporter, partial [Candidatus Latescibacterota bacterium]
MNHTDRRILAVTCFGHFMSHVNMLVYPALVLPLAARLDLEVAAVLGMSFWMYLLFGITALPWGVAADRWGAPPLLLGYHLGAGLSCAAVAWWMDDPARLPWALAALGLFSGVYHPAGLGWISKQVERVSLGLAYNGMAGNLGIALAPLLAGLVNWQSGPRAVYAIVAVVNGLGAILVLASPRRGEPRPGTALPDEGKGVLGGVVILLVAMMLGGLLYRGGTVILPAYLELKVTGIFEVMTGWLG